jgi:hypothetical protein
MLNVAAILLFLANSAASSLRAQAGGTLRVAKGKRPAPP